jgi:ribose-phosphate pyrophosphokinase
MSVIVLPLPGNEAMAQSIARAGDFELGQIETRRFPDGETYLRHLSPLKGRSVVLVCTLDHPDAKLVPLLFAANAAREQGARRVGLVAPYLAYMRQDRQFHAGEAVSARLFAAQLSANLDWLLTVEPHLHRVTSLGEVYSIPAKSVHAAPLLARWIGKAVPHPVVIGPDAESRQWVAAVAAELGAPFAVAGKTRLGDREVRIDLPDLEAVEGRTPIIVDDVVSSGRTLLELTGLLRRRFDAKPVSAVVHGLFAEEAYAQLRSECSAVVSTNTVKHQSNAIDVSSVLAHAVQELF